MKRPALLFALALAPLSGTAWACLPLHTSAAPPSVADRAQSAFESSTDIIFGVVVDDRADPVKFRVLHVYKGALKKGDIIRPQASAGFDAMPCAGMIAPRPNFKGENGVIAFDREPEMNFLPEAMLAAMFDAGLIRRAADRR